MLGLIVSSFYIRPTLLSLMANSVERRLLDFRGERGNDSCISSDFSVLVATIDLPTLLASLTLTVDANFLIDVVVFLLGPVRMLNSAENDLAVLAVFLLF